MAACDQLFYQADHVGLAVGARQYELGRARLERRRQAAKRIDIGMKLIGGLFRDLADRLVQRQPRKIPRGTIVDLVVDVGDVANVGDVIGAVEMPQQPEQHVEHDHRPRVADVREIVNRRSAHIHADIVGIERHEGALFAGQRIVKT